MSAPAPRKKRRFKKQVSERPAVVPFDPEGDAALCYVRQSHFSDESTSSESQVGDTHRWTNAYGIPIAETVQDLHVSGDLEPHKRNGLRLWLSDAPPKPWKTLVVSKLDRLVRNVMDALTLLEWLRARGKRLICIAEGIDSSNSMSEFMITLIAAFARMERERMKERFRSAKARLKEAGRWGGEGHIYGTMPVELPGGGWVLGLDQYAVKILHQLSKMARMGQGLTDMSRWLMEKKVVTPRDRQLQLGAERRGEDPATVELKGYEWKGNTLGRLLTDPALVEFGIFEAAEQAEIIMQLQKRSKRKERGSNQPYEFSGILVCAECLESLWHRINVVRRKGKDGNPPMEYLYHYWYCPTRIHGPSIRADEIEPLATQAFYKIFAMVPVRERIVLPPTNHANQIEKLRREYGKVMSEVARADSQESRRKIMTDGEKILADIDTLKALPVDPGGIQWVPANRTWKQELEGLSPEERRIRWLDVGFQFAAQKLPNGILRAGWRLPEGWQEAMPEIANWLRNQASDTHKMIEIGNLLNWKTPDPANPKEGND